MLPLKLITAFKVKEYNIPLVDIPEELIEYAGKSYMKLMREALSYWPCIPDKLLNEYKSSVVYIILTCKSENLSYEYYKRFKCPISIYTDIYNLTQEGDAEDIKEAISKYESIIAETQILTLIYKNPDEDFIINVITCPKVYRHITLTLHAILGHAYMCRKMKVVNALKEMIEHNI